MNLDIANNMRQVGVTHAHSISLLFHVHTIPAHTHQTPLHLAVITRQPQMVQLLVRAGASVNFPDRKGNTALHLAAARRDVRILQLLAQATNPLPDYNAKNFAGTYTGGSNQDATQEVCLCYNNSFSSFVLASTLYLLLYRLNCNSCCY